MSTLPPIQLVWFKRDLRTSDHAPLYQASQAGPYLGLYIYEPKLIEADDFCDSHLQFLNQSLRSLRARLCKLGSELLLRRGDALCVFEALRHNYTVSAIWAHEETGNNISYQRDRRMRRWCRQHKIRLIELPNNGVVRRLQSRDGWARQWQTRMVDKLVPEPAQSNVTKTEPAGNLQTEKDFQLHRLDQTELQIGGEGNAHETLNSFLDHRGVDYRQAMSSPVTASESCSRMSPYLAFGNISIRQVYQATRQRTEQLKQQRKDGQTVDPRWLKSLSSYQSRLSWHCHFIQKLEDEPAIEFQNMNRAYDGLREDQFDDQKFSAWCDGRTGYPMVDACMRALKQTGWINFRMRAMLMSFAAYHLWLHWRKPALHLAKLFLDYEPGIHYSQCQMQSGVTGINTVRIYSPIKQVADQDPTGIFIRKFLPELNELPDKHLAEPHRMTLMEQTFYGCQIGKDYPPPIVNHREQYQAARDRIHAVKQSAATRRESEKVFQKHGSRKQPMSKRQ